MPDLGGGADPVSEGTAPRSRVLVHAQTGETQAGEGETVEARAVEAWAAGGAMALDARPGRPLLGPPAPLVDGLADLAGRLARATQASGRRVDVDGVHLLVQRAAIGGVPRRPEPGAERTAAGHRGPLVGEEVSWGGACRLLPTADGWLAVSLPRPDDIELIPAWLELDQVIDDPWAAVAATARSGRARVLAERAAWLGLAVARLGERGPGNGVVVTRRPGPEAPPRRVEGCRVVDLSSLWAGPLCGQLLHRAGADVVKVESTRRPDGSRDGPARFFDLMNRGKRSVALDFDDPADVRRLHRLVDTADVVIEASRPRALAQLGLGPDAPTAAAGPQVWVSITGYGRATAHANRVGFGDDTAVAGGLVLWDAGQPRFCADAVGDPLGGVAAAVGAVEALNRGGRWLVDVALASVAAAVAGPTLAVPAGVVAAAAPQPSPSPPGPWLGADTDAVLDELGLRS